MTVAELVEKLQELPQNLTVITPLHSEFVILRPNGITIESHCEPRSDGWVHNSRPDKPLQEYVIIEG